MPLACAPSRNNFTKFSITRVRKLTNKKVQRTIRELENVKPPDDIARIVRVSRRRIYHLKQQYQNAGVIPDLKIPGARRNLWTRSSNESSWTRIKSTNPDRLFSKRTLRHTMDSTFLTIPYIGWCWCIRWLSKIHEERSEKMGPVWTKTFHFSLAGWLERI